MPSAGVWLLRVVTGGTIRPDLQRWGGRGRQISPPTSLPFRDSLWTSPCPEFDMPHSIGDWALDSQLPFPVLGSAESSRTQPRSPSNRVSELREELLRYGKQ